MLLNKRAKILSRISLNRNLCNAAPKLETLHHENYQFLQCSKVPTMKFQQSLPRLPIPKLELTCKRYLAAVEPISSSEEQSETQQLVSEFSQGIGNELNEMLNAYDRSNKHTSYISEPWFDMYLSDRSPLPINYNPVLVLKDEIRPDYQNQVVRATNLLISSLRFWRALGAEKLEPEVFHLNPNKSDTDTFRRWAQLAPSPIATYVAYGFKAFPLDMCQYSRLFGVTRVPKFHKDELKQCSDSKHIIVMRRGNMYAVDVLDGNSEIEAPRVILERIKAVIQLDEEYGPAEVPLGVLTTENRNTWAMSRQHLEEGISDKNGQLLREEVDKALFCLCLDDEIGEKYSDANPTPLLKHMLGGNAGNRWFDKSVSLLVGVNGAAAVNFEHSWGDGVAVLRYFNEIYKDTLEKPFVCQSIMNQSSGDSKGIRRLNFDIDDKLRADVLQAAKSYTRTFDNLNLEFLRYPHINKVICKRVGISPDSIMQLSFQLAYRQAFGSYVGSYESCSTAAFRHGRTEAIRPCTMATKRFCEALLQRESTRPSKDQLRALMNECSTVHATITKEAAMGQGFDRHLFALKHMSIKSNIPLPKIYSSVAYQRLNYNIISTSTLSSNALLAGTFGPVVSDGLGIGYSIQKDECGAVVTSYANKRNGKDFIDCFGQALDVIKSILDTRE